MKSAGDDMKKLFCTLCLALLAFCFAPQFIQAQVAVLCYHEIDHPKDYYSVKQSMLEAHLDYLKKNGYHFVTLNEYLDYTAGKITLPDKSVMLTFDDGYLSFYTKVYPLLQKYQVPAMLAIVTSWTDGEGLPSDVRSVATWAQLREMEKSGLVTVVSHTHALHKQQAIDPQGDRNGIAGYHLYINGHYETDEEYKQRLENDLAETQRLFVKNLGHPSQVLVWPYGIYSAVSMQAAADHGMTATFLLNGGVNTASLADQRFAKRMIMGQDTDVKRLQQRLTTNHDTWNSKPLRLAQVDLDNLYDKDPVVFQQNLKTTLAILRRSKINVVALQAFADPDGDGNVSQVYFYNQQLPVAADIFNAAANAMQQRGMMVVAWLPGLTYQPFINADNSNAVQGLDGQTGWYRRLSPFDTQGVEKVARLYRDLSTYTVASGVLLQDDLYLNDFEDASPYGQAAYQKAFGHAFSKNAPEAEQKQWMELKTRQLNQVSETLLGAFKENRPLAITMRDLYDEPVRDPDSQAWFAQNYKDALKRYDYTVVMAYPQMNEEKDADAYLKEMAGAVKEAGGSKKTIVKIQTYDWKKEKWLDKPTFQKELKELKEEKIRNRGTYPQTYHPWGS